MFTISRVPSSILRDMTEIKVYYCGGNDDYFGFGKKPELSTVYHVRGGEFLPCLWKREREKRIEKIEKGKRKVRLRKKKEMFSVCSKLC